MPGAMPESYWQWWLGAYYHLRPSDLRQMTPRQMMDCYEHLPKEKSG